MGTMAGPRLGTLCVHGGLEGRAAGQPLVPSIERSVSFRLDDAAYELRRAGRTDESRVYARETSPTLEALEERLRLLEGAERALVFASGTAALHALAMATLERGDNVVAVRQLYGGTFALLRLLLPKLGVDLRTVAFDESAQWERAVDEHTRLFLCESISNPLTSVVDVTAAAEVVRRRSAGRARVAVDATLATPIGQRPLALGADVVWHSATKYLGGHGDLTGGVIAGGGELVRSIWQWRTTAGGCLDPEAAFLLARGLTTLRVRMGAHAENALAVARALAEHPRVERVHFCGLEGEPGRLLESPGGLLSFVVAGGDEEALGVIRRLRVFTEAASLGCVESLATRPVDLSHAYLSEEERVAAGVVPGMVRLAVGLEDQRDLVADLLGALG